MAVVAMATSVTTTLAPAVIASPTTSYSRREQSAPCNAFCNCVRPIESSTSTSTSCFTARGSYGMRAHPSLVRNHNLDAAVLGLGGLRQAGPGPGPGPGRSLGSSRRRRVAGSGSGLGSCRAALGKLDEADTFDLSGNDKDFPAEAGVYAVYDKEGKLQYVGISRRVSASLQTHLQDVPELCGSAKVGVVETADRTSLTEGWKQWIQEHVDASGEAPPGNLGGVTTWTTRKSKAKPELKLTPGPNKELAIPLTELIDKVVKDIPVVAFIKGTRLAPQCGFSHRVLTILNENRVDYEVVNVLDDHFNPGLREAIKDYSKWPTIPQVYVKGEFVGGADILNELAEKGEVKTLFK